MLSCTYPALYANGLVQKNSDFTCCRVHFPRSGLRVSSIVPPDKSVSRDKLELREKCEVGYKLGFKWVEVGPGITDEQKEAISRLPSKMERRCKALMRQIICFSCENGSLSDLLDAWVRLMKPRRADWLAVLKELNYIEHPLYLEVAKLALSEDSFEANIRDYTKIIHAYGKQNRLQEAENIFLTMKENGFVADQVTLTAMVHMYSKAGNFKLAAKTFEEIKLLGEPLDKRSYGSMIMAYIRAGMPGPGYILLEEMNDQEIYPQPEVYKALLRAFSLKGDAEGAQKVFDAIQLAGICLDVKLCGLLINAYSVAGQSHKARTAFENMRAAGIDPNDKCVALILTAYEKENNLKEALEFLMDLERSGIIVEGEASNVLAAWFSRLGVIKEVEHVLSEYAEMKSGFKGTVA